MATACPGCSEPLGVAGTSPPRFGSSRTPRTCWRHIALDSRALSRRGGGAPGVAPVAALPLDPGAGDVPGVVPSPSIS